MPDPALALPTVLPTVRVLTPSALVRAGLVSLLSGAGFSVTDEAAVWVVDDSALSDVSALADAPALVAVGSRVWADLLPDLLPGGWAALNADVTQAELLAGVLGAAAGLVVLPPERLDMLNSASGTDLDPSLDTVLDFTDDALDVSLTPREREVLTLLTEGLSNKRAAKQLGVSESTVKFHVQAIYSKLGVQSRAAAVTRGIQLGLVSV